MLKNQIPRRPKLLISMSKTSLRERRIKNHMVRAIRGMMTEGKAGPARIGKALRADSRGEGKTKLLIAMNIMGSSRKKRRKSSVRPSSRNRKDKNSSKTEVVKE
jgi:hypothetical protein